MKFSRQALLERHPWLPFVLPLVVYMLLNTFEPSLPEALPPSATTNPDELAAREQMLRESGSVRLGGLTILYEHYPLVYTAKIAITAALLIFVWPAYREFPCKVSWLAIAVGTVGIFVWIGLCHLQLEPRLFGLLGWESMADMGERPSYNPLEQLKDSPAWAYAFLAIRFAGLVVVVPIIEEMFYRAFLMRFVVAPEWWKVPIGTVSRMAIFMGTGFPALAHLGEIFAALAWFGMITWLLIRTKNIWDTVAAHAVTNLLLGIYVLMFSQWHLW